MIPRSTRAAPASPPRRFLAVQAQHFGYVGRYDPELTALHQKEGNGVVKRIASIPPWSAKALGTSVPIENNTHLKPFFDKKLQSKLTLLAGLSDRILMQTHDAPVKLVANTFPMAKYEGDGIVLTTGQGDIVKALPTPDPFKGATVDQIAAAHLSKAFGSPTPLASLTLQVAKYLGGGTNRGWTAMSYKSATQPIPADRDPVNIFNRLFAGYDPTATADELVKRQAYNKSVLDGVKEQATDLRGKLGRTDQQKLDEYFEGVRDLEKRLTEAKNTSVNLAKPGALSTFEGNENRDRYQQVMQDLIANAFITDRTRVIAFGTQYAYNFLKLRSPSQQNLDYSQYRQFNGKLLYWGAHEASHYDQSGVKGVDPTPAVTADKKDHIEIFTHWQLEHFANLLAKLDAQMDIDGKSTVLDNMVALYGGDIGESAIHAYGSIPCILGGRGGFDGTNWRIKSGRQLKFSKTERGWKDLLWGIMNILGVPDPSGAPRLKTFGYAKTPLDIELAS